MMGEQLEFFFRDPAHIDAHRRDFAISIDEVVALVMPRVTEAELADGAWLHDDFVLPVVVGKTGLLSVPPDGSRSFWAYRRGRQIPSHLSLSDKSETTSICVWGYRDGDRFVVHTLYPGRKAPREIHDPELSLTDLPVSITFWQTHAIATDEGDFSFDPYV